MTDYEVKQQKNHLEMMRRPHLWPGLVLPLILRKKLYDTPLGASEGILWCDDYEGKSYSWLPNHNMFTKIPEDADWIKGGDELLQKLVNEGWEVD